MGIFVTQFLVPNKALAIVSKKQWKKAIRKVAKKMQKSELIHLHFERYDTVTFVGDESYYWWDNEISPYALAEWSDIYCQNCNHGLSSMLEKVIPRLIQQQEDLRNGVLLLFNIIPKGFFCPKCHTFQWLYKAAERKLIGHFRIDISDMSRDYSVKDLMELLTEELGHDLVCETYFHDEGMCVIHKPVRCGSYWDYW